VRLATFPNELGLSNLGNSLFGVSANSGNPTLNVPGKNGSGTVVGGTLEMSNTNATNDMVGMITTQRAYEAVSKVVSASDEMLQIANQLRR
jgi:flagellar hook-basal body protein